MERVVWALDRVSYIMIWKSLLEAKYKDKIQKILPVLFNMVELENRRGKKLGMEVGNARERVIIALLMYVYGRDAVEFPPSTSAELDVIVNENPISIKTKSTKGFSGVKMSWTVDWEKANTFIDQFQAQSDLLYINILWNDYGGFFIIPKKAQQIALKHFGPKDFFKLPKQKTNPRGVELSSSAMQFLQQHEDTHLIDIYWERDSSLLVERALYGRWIELWDTL